MNTLICIIVLVLTSAVYGAEEDKKKRGIHQDYSGFGYPGAYGHHGGYGVPAVGYGHPQLIPQAVGHYGGYQRAHSPVVYILVPTHGYPQHTQYHGHPQLVAGPSQGYLGQTVAHYGVPSAPSYRVIPIPVQAAAPVASISVTPSPATHTYAAPIPSKIITVTTATPHVSHGGSYTSIGNSKQVSSHQPHDSLSSYSQTYSDGYSQPSYSDTQSYNDNQVKGSYSSSYTDNQSKDTYGQ